VARSGVDLVTGAVTGSGPAPGSIGIIGLVEVCASMSVRNRRLFERLGAWVADEPDAALQRRFAVASHRHAWHAELWEARRPAIPVDATLMEHPVAADPADRVAWYQAELTTMRNDLGELAGRIDPVLDPSTHRVIGLVLADLADLADVGDRGDPGVAQTARDGG
jgi:hypothetical protein